MKRAYLIGVTLILLTLFMDGCRSGKYESVNGDPTKTRIYTLDNGLKVYLSVNKDEPRIQANIAVRVGSKNDPSETTGLAHYFEHLMFKGTSSFGTQDYEKEKPLLDAIEKHFELYCTTTGEVERRAIYKVIDSLSYEASKYSIANEYDKIMSYIGATGTNAYTSYDMTVYVENIPSNQVENWARVQSDRFRDPVLRGFHTELETVYEENNMYASMDSEKVWDLVFAELFPEHPYGQQTILGTQEHLKNPSITNIRNYHGQWYVPNNIAICLSGDLYPDQVMEVIERYFGDWEPNPELAPLGHIEPTVLDAPVVKTIVGPDAANVTIAWRTHGAADPSSDIIDLVNLMINNGRAGIMDVELLQAQKILDGYGYSYTMADHGIFLLNGTPKVGQSLEEVGELLLGAVGKLRTGDFDGELLEASVNNVRATLMRYMDDNESRASLMTDAFVNGIPWEKVVNLPRKMAAVGKEDIVAYAREMFREDNYVLVYKAEGQDPENRVIEKPEITPILMNREEVSPMLASIMESEVKPVEPAFVDYDKDLTFLNAGNGARVIYKKNESNELFQLYLVFETGSNNDPALRYAVDYMEYLGTEGKTRDRINAEFYKLACNYSITCGDERTRISLSGLSENMQPALVLLESMLFHSQGDEEILENLKEDILQQRSVEKLDQMANTRRLRAYAMYGKEIMNGTVLSDEQIAGFSPDQLLGKLRELASMEHRVLYYGPATKSEVVAALDKTMPSRLTAVPDPVVHNPLPTPETKVYTAYFDMPQVSIFRYTNPGRSYDPRNDAIVRVYNEYFGSGMNSIVFQDLREARGLAYTAYANVGRPAKKGRPYNFIAFIGTQRDKMEEALAAFDEIINDMPLSENSFTLTKEALLASMGTERVIKSGVLWSWLEAQDLGLDYDRRREMYDKIKDVELSDVLAFQKEWVKDRNYVLCILGDLGRGDVALLESIGPVEHLTREELFGY